MKAMLESPSIQKTIYLYWTNYKQFHKIQKAVKHSQNIYMREHRYAIRLIQKLLHV